MTLIEIISVFFGIILVIGIFYLTHNQILNSKKDNEHSFKKLESEQDVLEKRISQRTQEYIASEEKRFYSLEQAARFGELSKGIFHDLMTPLTSLALYIQSIKSSNKEVDQANDLVNKAVQASERLGSFLDSVRRSIGDNEINKGLANKANLKKEILIARDILAYKARTSRVEIIIDKTEEINLQIHPVRLHQLLVNILSNGIDANLNNKSKSQKKFVKISGYRNENEIIIDITDNGIGMSEEKVSNIFTNPSTSKLNGTGIGLVTTKNIIENELHGTIKVTSKENSGTKFEIVIPSL